MLKLDRRMLLRAGSAAVGAAALAPNVPVLAHAPQAAERPQPGFYRFKLGTIEITVISDGTLAFRPKRSGSIGPRTQEAFSHPRSSRPARSDWKSTPSSSTPATSWC
jgi:hypothetical protein